MREDMLPTMALIACLIAAYMILRALANRSKSRLKRKRGNWRRNNS